MVIQLKRQITPWLTLLALVAATTTTRSLSRITTMVEAGAPCTTTITTSMMEVLGSARGGLSGKAKEEDDKPRQPLLTPTASTSEPGILRRLFTKCQGSTSPPAPSPSPPWSHSLTSLLHASLSLTALSLLAHYCATHHPDHIIMIPPFGASAVLLHSASKSPFAQPRNVILGHTLSGLVGVTVNKLLSSSSMSWLAPGLAVGLACLVMERTNSIHPPGGATALLAVIGPQNIKRQGYLYVLAPCLATSTFVIVVSLLLNNLHPNRQYPLSWDFYPLTKKLV